MAAAQLCFLSVLQGCRNGERKVRGCVAQVLCVSVTCLSQLWGLNGEGRKQVNFVVLRGSQHVLGC